MVCEQINGVLFIDHDPAGQVGIASEISYANAQAFTSLEGVTFSRK